MEKALWIHCPTCKKKFEYKSSEFRPFCTERCRMVDLGHWFEESYSVAGEKVNLNLKSLDEEFEYEKEDEEKYDEYDS